MASYIRGRYANGACDLMDELERKGIRAMVGYYERNRQNTLIVHVDPCDFAKVPSEWRGFRIKVEDKADLTKEQT